MNSFMNKFKIYNLFVIVALAVAAIGYSGCTDDFDELNTKKTKLSELGPAEYPYLFSKAQSASSYAFWRYQVAQNLFSDLYSQYYALTAPYFPSDRYVMRMDWLQWHWTPIYTEAVPQMKTLLTQLDPSSAEYAMTQVLWVYTFHRVTDYYGPIPYFQAGEPLASVPYDAQEAIYDDFFAKLDAATKTLQTHAGGNAFGSFDLVFAGDVDKWIKFANTLRLRLALRISKVDPGAAKTEAEAAVSGGVMEVPADDALMVKNEAGGDFNGLSGISVWNEFRMSASMESALKGYSDPRLGVYFQPAIETGTYEGLRNGLLPEEQNQLPNTAQQNSNVGTRWTNWTGSGWAGVNTAPQNIMHAAEAWFNRAEGALNGWNMGGTAEELYNNGIEASMNQWGISDAAAIAAYQASTATPIAPGDQQNSPAMNDTPIKWGGDEATNRAQVGMQKWLALFPDGIEAWADLRRAKQPQLYPVVHSDNADLPAGTSIRRIPFLTLERQTNGAAVDAAVPLLGGDDKVSTPLWWDK